MATGKSVLFVEGKDDAAVYAKWLAKLDPLYGNRLEVVPTTGRNDMDEALKSLGHPASAYALRNRDEWDAGRIATAGGNPSFVGEWRPTLYRKLFLRTRRSNIRSSSQDAARYGPSEAALCQRMSTPLSDWVDHWALWTTAMQLQADMVSAGYASFYHDVMPLPPDPDIQIRLQSWADLAAAGVVWNSFSALRASEQARPVVDKHRGCVHGKKYWNQGVLPALGEM